MAKISQVTNKYIVNAEIIIEGNVDRPDVIGAIFGQTEGLLGSDLELRELQRSGRIGRIEVIIETKAGKSKGTIIIPSSLDKAETAIIAASLEVIERIGPCNAHVKVHNIEDVRIIKRKQVVERAKELLQNLTQSVLPDSQEIADEVATSVRVAEIANYGKDKLAAGPAIDESEEVIVVEGRADVVTLLKAGFKNAISMNGANVPETIIELSKKKSIIAFVDGDRGGDLNIKSLLDLAEIDFVAKAPDGKEVEELAKKEIHKALRSKITAEQAKLEIEQNPTTDSIRQHKKRDNKREPRNKRDRDDKRTREPRERRSNSDREEKPVKQKKLTDTEKEFFKGMLDEMVGTHGANILDSDLNVLGKVPVSELENTLENLDDVFAVVFDGKITRDLTGLSKKQGVKFLVGNESEVKPNSENRIKILTANYFN